jgi:hypothetical protein
MQFKVSTPLWALQRRLWTAHVQPKDLILADLSTQRLQSMASKALGRPRQSRSMLCRSRTVSPICRAAPLDQTAFISKAAPHLAAILNRARKALPYKPPSETASSARQPHPDVEYRPSSIPSFLSRLATFKLSTYANKPREIDAVAAARCGWINEGRDRLRCAICDVSWVLAGRDGMKRDAGKKVGLGAHARDSPVFAFNSQCVDREAKSFIGREA